MKRAWDDKWRTIRCGLCIGGIEITSGTEAVECDCYSGVLFIRPSGHIFQYPSGPARGKVSPSRYKTATPVEPPKILEEEYV